MSDKKFPKTPPMFICESCDVTCCKTNDWNRHLLTAKHKKRTASDEKVSENSVSYFCKNCDYKCCKESLWSKHILTAKHIKQPPSESETSAGYSCDQCNKQYTCYSSLWSHKKKCKKTDFPLSTSISTSMIQQMLIDNKELRNFVMEQSKVLTEQCK